MSKFRTFKELERYLHPVPKVEGGGDILHDHSDIRERHKERWIVFSYWKDKKLVSDRHFSIPREDVFMFREDLYTAYEEKFLWLTGGKKIIEGGD